MARGPPRGRRPRLRYNPPRNPGNITPLTSTTAQVIKTRIPDPVPSADLLLDTVHNALDNLKARDVVRIDVRGKTSVCDYMVIASGTSTRHVKSIADEVIKDVKTLDYQPLGVEGEPWPRRLKLRAGAYVEPGRNAGVSARMHFTAGFDVRLFVLEFTGPVNPWDIRVGATMDLARDYSDLGLSLGFWY